MFAGRFKIGGDEKRGGGGKRDPSVVFGLDGDVTIDDAIEAK
jgi:hypothetical protein